MRDGYLRIAATLAATAALAGCASASPIERLLGGHAEGDADGVVVLGLRGLDALPVAVAHCARFKKDAERRGRDPRGASYACVARG